MTAADGVEVIAGVKVIGTAVAEVMVIVCVTTCVSVPVGVVGVLVSVADVALVVAVIGNGRMIGVGLKMTGVEEGRKSEKCREAAPRSSRCILRE